MSNFLHHLFQLLSFFMISIAAQSNDSSYPNCPSHKCGNITISYPFWRIGSETATHLCGYQGFGINCSNNSGEANIPTITFGHHSYYVPNIIYENKSMFLVDYDFSPFVPVIDCPRLLHSINFESLPFNFFGHNVNLSFHFDCSNVPYFASEIPCLSSPTNKSCVNNIDSEPGNFSWNEFSCDEHVVTTVLDVFGSTRPLGTDFCAALREGFEIEWGRVEVCEKCEESGGRCGYSGNTTAFMCLCTDGTTTTNHCDKGLSIRWRIKLVLGVGSAVVFTVLVFIIYCIMKKSSPSHCFALFKHQTEENKNVEAFVMHYGSVCTKRYTYVDIKKMTNSFRVKLGQGGFGTVFKGKLPDGRLVAVKILNSSKSGGQEFINEVASIGRTCHINIVSLLGFCFDYQNRALIYEFMPNGSLEKFIYSHIVPLDTSDHQHIGVDKLYEVVIGIARGLDYLHRGCTTRILHLDIKPHNILLDEDFCPKIADFGLAKLYSRKDSIISSMEARGTIGYIAPEVFNRNFGGVSYKSDVYSYGMLILEMVGGRTNVNAGVGFGHTSEIYFPYWIYNRLRKNEFLLEGVTSVEENDYARKMTIVGLWCIQTDPNQRPYISEVIEMLEGPMEALEIPPTPFFSSPPQWTASTLNTSQQVSEDHCS